MKITRQQLRQLIESSVIKRGDDYVAPVETPLEDPRDFDFDLSDENKKKLFDLVGGDDASQAQADSLADTLDFPKSDRFGADTFSKQTKMYDMSLDVINDPEIDQLLDRAIELYFDQYKEYIIDDLFHVLQTGYKYPTGAGGFQLFLEGDPDFDDKYIIDVSFFDPRQPALNDDMIRNIMRKVNMMIGVKLMNLNSPSLYSNAKLTKDFFDFKETPEPSPEEQQQRAAKLRKAAELFKRRTKQEDLPAVTQHVYDKMMEPMYEIFTAAHKKYNPRQDMSQIKESNVKITRKKLRRLIIEAMFDPRAARAKARGRTKQSIPGNKMSILADMLDSEDEETAIQGHSMLDALGDYDSPTGAGSYQDIKDFDQQMDDAMASQRKMQALDDWEKYMAAAGPEVRSVVNKLTQPGVDLYVVSHSSEDLFRAPGEEVVRRPENFHLMAISSPTGGFSFADDIGTIMGIDFEGDDMDAILIFLEQLADDNNIGYIPTGYKFSPEDAFMAWITENNPNLRIFVDP